MIFGRKGKQKFYLGKKELKIVKSYKYLGLMLDKVHGEKYVKRVGSVSETDSRVWRGNLGRKKVGKG